MITITEQATLKMMHVLSVRYDMVPMLTLKKGGCAGNILAIELKNSTDVTEYANVDIGLQSKLYVDTNAQELVYTNELIIDIKDGIEKQLIVRNLSASNKCKCGKSFTIQ